MNIQSLSYFIEITHDLNITRTAERLHMTQQCLSGHVKRLEEYYGVALFERKPKLALTYAGQQLLAYAEKTMAEEKEIFDDLYLISKKQRGTIRVGITPARSEYLLPMFMGEFVRKHPKVNIDLCETSTITIDRMLVNGEIDAYIGVYEGNYQNITRVLLRKEPIYLVISNALLYSRGSEAAMTLKWQTEQDGGVGLDALRDYPFLMHSEGNRMRFIEDSLFAEAGFDPITRLSSQASPTLLKLCYQGLGATIVNSMNFAAVQPSKSDAPISFFPVLLDKKPVAHSICLLYKKNNGYPAYFEDFIQMVKNRIHEGDEKISFNSDEYSIYPM